jgi:hypothetical protein
MTSMLWLPRLEVYCSRAVLDGARNVKLFDEENKEVSFAEEFIIPLSVVS